MSRLLGIIFLIAGALAVAVIYYPPARIQFDSVRVKYECSSGKTQNCAKFAESLIRKRNYSAAFTALEKNCSQQDMKSCFRLAQVLESREQYERANLYFELACQSGYKGACEAYGQFLAGPALGKVDGVPSMKIACTGGEAEACAFVAAAAYASGNFQEAYSYWAHICQKLGEAQVCAWGAKKFEEIGQPKFSLALHSFACKGGYQSSCQTLTMYQAQQARVLQAQNEAKMMGQKRALASSQKPKKTSAKAGIPLQLPPKKKRR